MLLLSFPSRLTTFFTIRTVGVKTLLASIKKAIRQKLFTNRTIFMRLISKSFKLMSRTMNRLCRKFQIFYPIVQSISVLVMDDLFRKWLKLSPNKLFHYYPMEWNLFFIHINKPIPRSDCPLSIWSAKLYRRISMFSPKNVMVHTKTLFPPFQIMGRIVAIFYFASFFPRHKTFPFVPRNISFFSHTLNV